jgi:hypothetical protein
MIAFAILVLVAGSLGLEISDVDGSIIDITAEDNAFTYLRSKIHLFSSKRTGIIRVISTVM